MARRVATGKSSSKRNDVSLRPVGDLLGALGDARAPRSGAVKDAFAALSKAHGHDAARGREQIGLNADGYPVQVVIRLDRGDGGYGFIFDPTAGGQTAQAQRRRSIALVRAASTALGLPPPATFESLLLPILQGGDASMLEARQSAVWIAVAAAGLKSKLKLYISLDGLDDRDRWRRFGELLAALGDRSALAAFCAASSSVTCESTPVAVGVDFNGANAPARVKLYVTNKACGDDWLRRWYALSKSADAYEVLRSFQEICGLGGYRRYHPRSFFVATDFGGRSGDAHIKTDIPICRWLGRNVQARALLEQVVDRFGLREQAYPVGLQALSRNASEETSASVAAEVASPQTSTERRARSILQLIGLGGDLDAAPYINAYLRPQL